MTEYINGYQDYLKKQKSASANTIESYMRDIMAYTQYLSVKGFNNPLSATADNIRQYLDNLLSMNKTQSTVTRSLASVRSFYQYLIAHSYITANPTNGIKLNKIEKKLPDILSKKEIEMLLAAPDISDTKGIRDKAMLELLYATGIRVSELIDANVTDVNTQIGILHCKSDKNERVVPMYPIAIKAIDDYMKRVRPFLRTEENEQALFTNMNGQRMTRQGFWKIIKYYADSCGIKKSITPHTIRHSFAAHLLENGAGLSDIKEMLGHSDISSTQIYSQLMKQKYASAYKTFHPRSVAK